ncbi:hypothetical protein LY76DRAFT_166022 [Colletotrichum caudatum]|nr:hypothetical protein LY76DRAFT_304344 [Colletotrichum caudatum]KAK2056056.1 hypothetical protein LY76DRAFT_166022 [Colletotrichum caudatum]
MRNRVRSMMRVSVNVSVSYSHHSGVFPRVSRLVSLSFCLPAWQISRVSQSVPGGAVLMSTRSAGFIAQRCARRWCSTTRSLSVCGLASHGPRMTGGLEPARQPILCRITSSAIILASTLYHSRTNRFSFSQTLCLLRVSICCPPIVALLITSSVLIV